MTSLRQDPLEGEHRGIGREDDELSARGRQLQPAIERAREIRLDLEGGLV